MHGPIVPALLLLFQFRQEASWATEAAALRSEPSEGCAAVALSFVSVVIPSRGENERRNDILDALPCAHSEQFLSATQNMAATRLRKIDDGLRTLGRPSPLRNWPAPLLQPNSTRMGSVSVIPSEKKDEHIKWIENDVIRVFGDVQPPYQVLDSVWKAFPAAAKFLDDFGQKTDVRGAQLASLLSGKRLTNPLLNATNIKQTLIATFGIEGDRLELIYGKCRLEVVDVLHFVADVNICCPFPAQWRVSGPMMISASPSAKTRNGYTRAGAVVCVAGSAVIIAMILLKLIS